MSVLLGGRRRGTTEVTIVKRSARGIGLFRLTVVVAVAGAQKSAFHARALFGPFVCTTARAEPVLRPFLASVCGPPLPDLSPGCCSSRCSRVARSALAAPFAGCRSIEVIAEDGTSWQLLAGKTSEDNDRLSIEEGRASEPWLHAAGVPGAHVVIRRVDEGAGKPPDDVVRKAAGIAAFYSKAKGSRGVPVHLTTCGRVSKASGAPAGQVQLSGSFDVLKVTPLDPSQLSRGSGAKETMDEESKAGPPTAKPLSLAQQLKKQDKERAWMRRQAQRLEENILSLEEELGQLDAELASKGSDPQVVSELLEKRSRLEGKQEAFYKQWEDLAS